MIARVTDRTRRIAGRDDEGIGGARSAKKMFCSYGPGNIVTSVFTQPDKVGSTDEINAYGTRLEQNRRERSW